MKTHFLPPLLLLWIITSCNEPISKNEKQVTEDDPARVTELVKNYLSEHVADFPGSGNVNIDGNAVTTPGLIKEFYQANGFAPVWTASGTLTPAGDSLRELLLNAEDWGLIPADYHARLIDSLARTAYDSVKEDYSINKLAHSEILLTDAFFNFAVHVSVGRMQNDSAEERQWRAEILDTNLVAVLTDALKQKSPAVTFRAMEPQYAEYKALRAFIPGFRKEFERKNWEVLPKIEEDTLAFREALVKRLVDGHDLDTSRNGSDSLAVAGGLKSFQRRVGLEPDGKAGRNTVRALNVTYKDRIRQMAATLERWRIEPKREERYVWVNIPEFRMHVMDGDSMIMESRIVVGAPKTQTPELDSKINQMILFPYWHVPYSIAGKEILPHVKRDSTYLRKNRYEVLDRSGNIVDPNTVNWKKYSQNNLPYKFRQKTGDDNALGILKFNFNNKHGVYMHDTNSKGYFNRETRALSHGCMRLENYMQLAYYLIREDSVKMPSDTFDVYMKSGKQRTLAVRKPIPIHVRYFTCIPNSEGRIILYTDIYDRDKRMIRTLYGEKTEDKKEVAAKKK
ncbi:MAG: L,D-transpeptidase family protein [Bacteroidetes bacterium]|nr:L,D-transpeptidase family protein [Bacteroidota bacterium]